MLEESGGLTERSWIMRNREKKSQFTLNWNAALERLVIFVYFFLGMKDDVQMCCVVSCRAHKTDIWSGCNLSGFTGVQILLFLKS